MTSIIMLVLYLLFVMGIILIIRKTDKESFGGGLINDPVYAGKAMVDPSKNINEEVSSNLFINGEFRINNDKNDAILCLGNNCYSEYDLNSLINNPVPYEKYTDEKKHLEDGSSINVSVPTDLCFDDNCINKDNLRLLNEKDGVLIEATSATPYVNERGVLSSDSPYYSTEDDARSSANKNDHSLLPQTPFMKPVLQALKVDIHEGITDPPADGNTGWKHESGDGKCMPGYATGDDAICKPNGGGHTSLYCDSSKYWRCDNWVNKRWHDGEADAVRTNLDVIAAVSDEYNIEDAVFRLVPGTDTNVTCM